MRVLPLLCCVLFGAVVAGCASDDRREAAGSEQDVRKQSSCDAPPALKDHWELLLIESEAKEITREELPPSARTYFDEVQGSDLVAFHTDFEGKRSFAVTWWPNDTDEILGEVAVFDSSGVLMATGYWKDSPQIFWRDACR